MRMFAVIHTLIHCWQMLAFSTWAIVLQFITVLRVCSFPVSFLSAFRLCEAASLCLSTRNMRRWSTNTMHEEQSNRPSSTWNVPSGEFVALSFPVIFTGICDHVFSFKEALGVLKENRSQNSILFYIVVLSSLRYVKWSFGGYLCWLHFFYLVIWFKVEFFLLFELKHSGLVIIVSGLCQ